MLPEGVARLYANALNDGPFPEHYEAVEAVAPNVLHPKVTSSPVTKKFGSNLDKYGTPNDFPIVCSTYRLTEMYHYWTKHHKDGRLNEVAPGFFVEIPEDLAKEKGIGNGEQVKVTSARGSIVGTAMVTKRLRQLKVDGQPHWHIGIPLHWGFTGAEGHTGPLANKLTPTVMDPNTWTPEYKVFLVKLEKAQGGVA
jgi:anaerobic selenocysteine-containing dehydrogenase